ncbi:30S ribosomal protein S15 [Candidatus Micrarchaeota archaeon]|nr:30S ribosomal protein S15 [Candidatus Micrarchaeota archaeon]
MAKLHSKKKGKAGSRKPKVLSIPEGVNYKEEEIKDIIRKLATEGFGPTRIGHMLRDEYAIPLAEIVLKKSISKFLEEENLLPKFPDDLLSLIKKAIKMRAHLKTNKPDLSNKVKLKHVESKIHRSAKYYKKEGKIPTGWKYDPETAALLIK